MEQLEKHRRPRRTKREKLEEELVRTEETIEQYTAALADMQEKKQMLLEEIENEQIREVTKILKEKKLSVGQLRELLKDEAEAAVQGA
ncbi:MAG: hypothetical protein HFG66_13760 [Hungatella sp.]|nr:hypothetical protein [Hungatella sp.]